MYREVSSAAPAFARVDGGAPIAGARSPERSRIGQSGRVGKRVIRTVFVAMTLAAACDACSGAGGATWHRSVTPDTPHRDADGLGRFQQARGDRTPADVASTVVKRELRREVIG